MKIKTNLKEIKNVDYVFDGTIIEIDGKEHTVDGWSSRGKYCDEDFTIDGEDLYDFFNDEEKVEEFYDLMRDLEV